jgi:hypothetical protein
MTTEHIKAQSPRILGRQGRYLVIACFFLGALLFWLAGCTTQDPVKGIFDTAISKLEQQSADWRKVLSDTKADLIKAGQSTLATEVQNVIDNAIGDAGAEVFCAGDYFQNRVKEDLIRIRATITGEKITLTPYFCNATPSQIDMF